MTSLSNNSIVLSSLRIEDAKALSIQANNRKIWENVRDIFPNPYSIQDARDFIGITLENDIDHIFGIRKDAQFCGVIGLHPQFDVYRKSAEIGYWLGEDYWGDGIATNAVAMMTEYGFNELGMVRIYAGVFEYNEASIRVLEKNGFTMEGIKRKAVFKMDKLWDEHMYALIHPKHI